MFRNHPVADKSASTTYAFRRVSGIDGANKRRGIRACSQVKAGDHFDTYPLVCGRRIGNDASISGQKAIVPLTSSQVLAVYAHDMRREVGSGDYPRVPLGAGAANSNGEGAREGIIQRRRKGGGVGVPVNGAEG